MRGDPPAAAGGDDVDVGGGGGRVAGGIAEPRCLAHISSSGETEGKNGQEQRGIFRGKYLCGRGPGRGGGGRRRSCLRALGGQANCRGRLNAFIESEGWDWPARKENGRRESSALAGPGPRPSHASFQTCRNAILTNGRLRQLPPPQASGLLFAHAFAAVKNDQQYQYVRMKDHLGRWRCVSSERVRLSDYHPTPNVF